MTRAGFTLLELVVTVAIIGVAGAVSLPLLATAADGYAVSTRVRTSVDQATFALGTVGRLLREVPASGGELSLQAFEASSFQLGDGRGVRLEARTLLLTDAEGATAPLCREVDAFVLRAIAADGATEVTDEPASAQRFEISITVSGMTLTTAAFPRSLTIGGTP